MKFFVYVDWTNEEIPRPYYVGKGQEKRVKSKRSRNKLHENLTRKYGLDRRVEFSTDSEQEAYNIERELIAKYKTYVHGNEGHWGANFSLGGDGSSGHVWAHTDETRQKLHLAHIGRKKSEETKRKMSEAARRRAADPVWREKMKLVASQRWQNPEHRKKRTGMKYNKKKQQSDE